MYSSATDEQKKRFLAPIASGQAIGSFGLTEETAGSDAAGQQTIATKDGDGYILNGTKIFNTNGPIADYTVIYALTDPALGIKACAPSSWKRGWKASTSADWKIRWASVRPRFRKWS